MNRREFMDALERQLQDVPLDDRIDALQYYEDYFEDAGYEKEQDIINELKSPENVANIIKKDLGIFKEGGSSTSQDAKSEYRDYRNTYNTGQGQQYNGGWTNNQSERNNYYRENTTQNYNSYGNNYSQYEEPMKNSRIDRKLVLIIFICTLPITIGPVLGFFGALFGIVVGVFATAFGLFAGGIGCIIGAIALLVTGSFSVASLVFGIGLILLAVALLAALLCSFMCRIVIPAVFEGIRTLYRYFFRNGETTV